MQAGVAKLVAEALARTTLKQKFHRLHVAKPALLSGNHGFRVKGSGFRGLRILGFKDPGV